MPAAPPRFVRFGDKHSDQFEPCTPSATSGRVELAMSGQGPVDLNAAVSLEEDPARFLARVRDACPDILSIITTEQAQLLTLVKEPYNPKDVSQSYVYNMGSYYTAKLMQKETEKNLALGLMKPLTNGKSLNFEEAERKLVTLKMVSGK